MGDPGPVHGSRLAYLAHKVKGRGGSVNTAEGVRELELGAGLVPDLDGGVHRAAQGEGGGGGGIVGVDEHHDAH